MKTASTYILIFFLSLLIDGSVNAQCPPAAAGYHRVQKGETLYRISRTYKVSVDQICAWNGINKSSVLKVCQELAIAPAKSSTPTTAPTTPKTDFPGQGGSHRIKPGETIAGLAELYGFTETRFREFNGLSPSEPAWPGLVLKTSDCNCPRPVDEMDPIFVEAGTDPINIPTEADFDPAADIPTWEESIAASDELPERKVKSPFGEDPFEGTAPALAKKKSPLERQSSPSFYNENIERINTSESPGSDVKKEKVIVDPKVKRSTTGAQAPNQSYISPEEELIRRNRKEEKTSTPNSAANSSATPALITKAAARYMTADEIEMVNEINLVRSNPIGYIKYIEAYKREIQAGRGFGSVDACNELIAELRRTPPMSILQPTECIYRAAKKHGLDQKSTGSTDHVGTDGSYPWDRVRKECPEMRDGNENIAGGPSSVREILMTLLIDDGIANRGHRRTLLDGTWKYVACYKIGTVGTMPNSWIQKFGK
ncbi:MAG: LysM peptidoglycan-binding domain-containing protein [Bacteroidota bacterium]